MTIVIGNPKTGRPDKPGVFVIRFQGEKGEKFTYWDGRSFSLPQETAYAAHTQYGGNALERHEILRKKVYYYRTVSDNDGKALLGALKGE